MPSVPEQAITIPPAAETAPRVELAPASDTQAGSAIPCRRIVTLIGSRPGCKIVLQNKSVSPVHAAIIQEGTRVIAVDLVSARGTLLNNLKMECEALGDGDVLSIGPVAFRVSIAAPPLPSGADAHLGDLEPSPTGVVLQHAGTGRMFKPNREVCIIGRRSGCDIAIHDTHVSRAHALIFHYQGYPAITDLLSENGTLVNDEPIRFRLLADDDVIGIAESRFRVRVIDHVVKPNPSRNGSENGRGHRLDPQDTPPDLVDIQATEGSQRWVIADHLEKSTRRK